MDYYMQKTFYKSASLISNSCKAIALLAGQSAQVAMLASEYGRNLVRYLYIHLLELVFFFVHNVLTSCLLIFLKGLAYQLIDDVLDFTGTSASLGKGSLSDIRQGIITALCHGGVSSATHCC